MTEADSASAGMTLPDVWRSHLADGVGVALRDHKAGGQCYHALRSCHDAVLAFDAKRFGPCSQVTNHY